MLLQSQKLFSLFQDECDCSEISIKYTQSTSLMSLHNTPVLVSCCLPTHWIPLWSIHSHSFNITQKTACFTQKHTQNLPGHIQLCVTRHIWSLLLKRKQPVPMQTPSHDTEDTREAESCRSSRFREIQHHTSTLYICCPHHTHRLFIIHVSEWWSCFYQRLLLWPVRAGRHLWARVSRWNPECKAAFFRV